VLLFVFFIALAGIALNLIYLSSREENELENVQQITGKENDD